MQCEHSEIKEEHPTSCSLNDPPKMVHRSTKWVRTYAKNEYTEIMWDYYRKHQQKRKCGLSKEIKSNDENRKHRQPQVTPEKEEMIREAFKHFNLIYVS